jgi:hypothetical protein
VLPGLDTLYLTSVFPLLLLSVALAIIPSSQIIAKTWTWAVQIGNRMTARHRGNCKEKIEYAP